MSKNSYFSCSKFIFLYDSFQMFQNCWFTYITKYQQTVRYQSYLTFNFYARLGLKLNGLFLLSYMQKNIYDIFLTRFRMDNIMRWEGIIESWKITLTSWSYHWLILDCLVSLSNLIGLFNDWCTIHKAMTTSCFPWKL